MIALTQCLRLCGILVRTGVQKTTRVKTMCQEGHESFLASEGCACFLNKDANNVSQKLAGAGQVVEPPSGNLESAGQTHQSLGKEERQISMLS